MEPLPPDRPRRGAPEFEALRTALREMADALEQGRAREIEAERLRAFRETARRVAHEMRNPLTPIRLAVAQLARSVGARPAGGDRGAGRRVRTGWSSSPASSPSSAACPRARPRRSTWPSCSTELARTSVPPTMQVRLALDPAPAHAAGPLRSARRAFSNILRNAVEACDGQGEIELAARPEDGGVRVEIRDHGPGVPPELAGRLFDPYVTGKSGGTGLGPRPGQADGRDAPGHASRWSRRRAAAPPSSCGCEGR